ncbi:hypothetical protein H8E07_10170, partial [bacterium]|nr:hypothetical protein [bacterium]
MTTRIPALIALLLCLALTPAAAEETDTPDAPEYTGTWIRNVDLSDDPAQILGRGDGAQPGQGRATGSTMRGGGKGRGSGMGRGGGMRGSPPNGGSNGPPPGQRPPRMMQGLLRLEIFHEGDEFAELWSRVVYDPSSSDILHP